MNHAIYFKGVYAVTKEKGCFPLLLRDLQKCDSTICEENKHRKHPHFVGKPLLIKVAGIYC